ncbi:MAG: tetratricopeptide repeat protein [Bacteroidota bacterium]
MRFKRIIFVSFAVLSLVACNDGTRKREEPVTDKDSTKTEVKIKKLNDAIMKDSGNASLFHKRALLQMERGVFSLAADDMKLAVQRDSGNADYFQLLADLSFRSNRVQDAILAFRKCLSIEPGNLEANLKFSELNLYLKAYPDALKYANDALRIDDRQAKAYFIKGFVYKETKDTAKAISSFQTVVEIDPEYYDAYIQLGNLLAERTDPLALQYYNNALRLRPASTEAFYARGILLQNMGQLERAESDYRAILKLEPSYAAANYNLGYIRLALKNDAAASIPLFTEAIRVSPDYVEAYYNRGMAYKLTGQKVEARKDFLKALALFPSYKLAQEQLKEMN